MGSELRPSEWDFREIKVPECELLPCFLYEYAREHIKDRVSILAALSNLAKCEAARKGQIRAYRTVADRLRTPYGLPLIRPDMLRVPWQETTPEERMQPAPKTGSQNYLGAGIHLAIASTAELPLDGGRAFIDFVIAFKSTAIAMHQDCKETEFGFFSVDWDYPSERIKAAFSGWLDKARKNHGSGLAALSMRGKKKADSPRGWLKALGAKRLRESGLTVDNAIKHCIRETRSALYQDKSDWSKARKVIVPAKLRELFGTEKLGA